MKKVKCVGGHTSELNAELCVQVFIYVKGTRALHLHMKSSYVYDTEVDKKKKEDRRHTSLPQFIHSFVIDFLAYSPPASF